MYPLDDYLDVNKGLNLCFSSWTRLSDNTIPTRAKASGGYLSRPGQVRGPAKRL